MPSCTETTTIGSSRRNLGFAGTSGQDCHIAGATQGQLFAEFFRAARGAEGASHRGI
jgi:hypothetical protein